MVAFVLHDAGMKTAHRTVNERTVFVTPLIAQMRVTRHQSAHAGNAEAAFPSFFHRIG